MKYKQGLIKLLEVFKEGCPECVATFNRDYNDISNEWGENGR